MDLKLSPGRLNGTVVAPPSKSELHRLLIASALAEGETLITAGPLCADTRATIACLRALGAEIEDCGGCIRVLPIVTPVKNAVLPCGESAATLRFLLPVVAALGCGAHFLRGASLEARPLGPLPDLLAEHGCSLSERADGLFLSGTLQSGMYALPAGDSSQYLSALLLALPLLNGESEIRITGNAVSRPYVEMTCAVLSGFGIVIERNEDCFRIPAASYRSPGALESEGDWSCASFWYIANALGSRIAVSGLTVDTLQGDRAVCALAEKIRAGNAAVDCSDCPDLFPPLAVLAAVAPGTTLFTGTARLRGKESDRVASMCALLKSLGGRCEADADSFRVFGGTLRGGTVDARGDHRIAMSAAVAATVCTDAVLLRGAECVDKSYPGFWRDYRSLGGKTE